MNTNDCELVETIQDAEEYVEHESKNGKVLNDICNIAVQGNELVVQLGQMYQQSLQIQRDVEAIHAWSNVELAKIAAKYKSCEDFLNRTFGERETNLDRFYNVLDRAIETNDRTMMIEAMRNMSCIVTSSPLQDLEKFAELYNDTSQPLLDF